MRQLLCYALAAFMAVFAWTAHAATAVKKKKSAVMSKKTAAARKTAAATKGIPGKKGTAARTVAKTGAARKSPVKATTWRNRQMAPSPERYKEIQNALVAKGFLKPEDAEGGWNAASVDALKKFQGAQNLDSSGKINSLSLIALGLGPKHDSNIAAKAAEAPQ